MKWVRRVLRMPQRRANALVVIFSVVLSEAISMGLSLLSGSPKETLISGALIAMVVPVMVAWPVGHVMLRLLHELEAARSEAQRLAHTDALTGALNRRRFLEVAEREIARVRHQHDAVSVLLLDVDDFKKINDRCGHQVGDQVIQAVSKVCATALRPSDPLARWGGEEFVALLPSAGPAEAIGIALRVRDAIAASVNQAVGDATLPERVTASVGVATDVHANEPLDRLISRADEAMYLAKRAGKNAAMAAP